MVAEIDSDPHYPTIHDRMPAILAKDDYAAWLGETPATAAQLKAMRMPFRAELMEAVKISTKVNNVKHEGQVIA